MAEPFKNLLGAAVVHDIGHHLARVWPAFDRQAFEQQALQGLAGLK